MYVKMGDFGFLIEHVQIYCSWTLFFFFRVLFLQIFPFPPQKNLLNFFVAHSLYGYTTFAQRIFSEKSGSILSKWISQIFYAPFKIQGNKTPGETLINDQQWNVSLLCPRGTQKFTKSCHLPPGQALRTLVLDVPCLVNTSALQSTGSVCTTGFLFKTLFFKTLVASSRWFLQMF